MKDLYDAVPLAELDGIQLSVLSAVPAGHNLDSALIRHWIIDGAPPGGGAVEPWLDLLATT